ncbi:DUF502 domain-containing protein [Cyclobacterium marinum]|uniref:DUF502 domain-containing protein n=1 Tax=Cyclobacterium marinum (strain ATCC 25205 / DSM 745 / LMG 13164 / NCIMB 1802) TaxID=880070 RepID=G0IZS5_CYCMS|nr:DUF502 domain-containing protein [Cyclobacterium marinum]AEL25739.1 protein of unknown function DUF502 [Cyclobacterium marinum DSM 745]MBI0401171.1 DUF502 domain-containing protein [Cyclobacterium marinum]MBR9773919.1 DUF502 domain-containing protein [Cytophagales bacterium]|tara:strand:+ start:64650 stop:65261 length:612 start_codon:yes stop_codon:yes gene_type:complete
MSDFTSKRILGYFLRGLLFVVPFFLTGYIIILTVQFLDNIIPVNIPGLGILVMLVFVTLVGYLTSIFITKSIFEELEKLVFKIPLVNILYTSIKDLMSAFVGDKKKFNTPIIVKLSDNMSRLGFMTQDDLKVIGQEELVAVYFPHSYNFSGNLYLVPRKNVERLYNVNSTEVMKFIVSGGVSDLHYIKNPKQNKATNKPGDSI